MAAPLLAPRGRQDVLRPTLGLFLDRPPIQVPSRGLQSCLNVRIQNGQILAEKMGWSPFPSSASPVNLDAEHVLLIENFLLRSGAQFLLFANRYDLFRYDEGALAVRYITPVYVVGQVTAAVYAAGPDETTLTGTGTAWATDPGDRNGDTNALVNDQVHIGSSTQSDPASTWFRVKQVNSDTEIVVEGDATAGFPGSFDYTLRQRFTGDNLDRWMAETFPAFDTGGGLEDRWYVTNSVNNVVRWRGTAIENFATRVNLGFTCKILRRFKNMMLYGNLLEAGEAKPQSIRNSDVAKPEDVTNGLASEFVPLESDGDLQSLLSLGDTLTAYAEDSVTTMEFVGDPFIFVSRTVVSRIGVIAPGAIVDRGDFHEFLGSDAAYRFNGVGVEELGSQVFREVIRTLSPGRLPKLSTHIDEENGEIQWIVPLTSDDGDSTSGPDRAFTEHYLELMSEREDTPFTFRDLPATATGYFERTSSLTWNQILSQFQNTTFRWNDKFFEALFPFNLFGDENGYVYILGASESQHDGTQTLPILSVVRTARRAAVDGVRAGMVKRVEPFARRRLAATDYTLTVRIMGTDRVHGVSSVLDAGEFDLTHAGERFVPLRAIARYVELEFETNGEAEPWDLDGWASTVVAAGSR